jgi:ribosomal protein L31
MPGSQVPLSGEGDKSISEWAVPQGIHPKILATTTARIACIDVNSSAAEELLVQDISTDANNHPSYTHHSEILAITTARDACIDGDLSTAEQLLTQDINADVNNHTSYAHRSFVMARKHDWDHALQDAIKSISIQPSLTGYISKGIALCGKGCISNARAAFDVASMYTDQDPETIHFLLLIKINMTRQTCSSTNSLLVVRWPILLRVVSCKNIYVFNSESKLWMAHVTTKPLTTSLPLSTRVLSHQNSFMEYTRTWSCSLAGTWSPCGKMYTGIGARHSFEQVNFRTP